MKNSEIILFFLISIKNSEEVINNPFYYCNFSNCIAYEEIFTVPSQEMATLKVMKSEVFPPESVQADNLPLDKLIAINVGILTLIPNKFGPMKNAKEIYLSYNKITYIPNNAFKNSRVQFLDISWNDIIHIDSEAFEDVPSLKILNLSHNKIMKFDSSAAFDALPLNVLDLSYNLLDTFNQYDPLRSLNILDLSFNHLKIVRLRECTANTVDLTMNDLDSSSFFTGLIGDEHFIGDNYIPVANYLKISFNRFTELYTLKQKLYNSTICFTSKLSLEGNPWFCSSLFKMYKLMNKLGIQYVKSNDDARIRGLNESFPICTTDNNTNSKLPQLAREVIGYRPLECQNDHDCPDDKICKNRQCWNPCDNNVCHETAVCNVQNHEFWCSCPRYFKFNPAEVKSRCYLVECFADNDCPNDKKCSFRTCI